jgi:hypothetical protein
MRLAYRVQPLAELSQQQLTFRVRLSARLLRRLGSENVYDRVPARAPSQPRSDCLGVAGSSISGQYTVEHRDGNGRNSGNRSVI